MAYGLSDKYLTELMNDYYRTLRTEHESVVRDATEKINDAFASTINCQYPDIWTEPPREINLQFSIDYVNLLSEYLMQEVETAKKHCIEKLQRYAIK